MAVEAVVNALKIRSRKVEMFGWVVLVFAVVTGIFSTRNSHEDSGPDDIQMMKLEHRLELIEQRVYEEPTR